MLASGSLGREIDLEELSSDIDGSKYESDFAGLIIQTPHQATILLFSSGKFSITGSKCKEDIDKANTFLLSEMEKLGISVEAKDPIVQNIVCTGDINTNLNLSHLAVSLGMSNIEYEPEQHPFLIYRPPSNDCVLTIATTGKAVITGLKSKEQAEKIFAEFRDTVSKLYEK